MWLPQSLVERGPRHFAARRHACQDFLRIQANYSLLTAKFCAGKLARFGNHLSIVTLQPSALERDSVNLCLSVPTGSFGSPSGSFITGNAWSSLTRVYETSMRAKSSPRHCLGPPMNGKWAHPISDNSPVSHLSGRKFSASCPNRFLRRELTYCEKTSISPFLTIMGLSPSGPPPTGSKVVLTASRLLSGIGGYNRRPRISGFRVE